MFKAFFLILISCTFLGLNACSYIELFDAEDGDSARASLGIENSRERSPQKKVSLEPARHYVGNLRWPLNTTKMTSNFGWRGRSFHEGIDLPAAPGTPIHAAHAGRVVFSGRGISGYGKVVVIKGEGLLTVYGHNRALHVSGGDTVKIGEHIADVGETGNATGPHLHFETRVIERGRSVAVSPLIFFNAKRR